MTLELRCLVGVALGVPVAQWQFHGGQELAAPLAFGLGVFLESLNGLLQGVNRNGVCLGDEEHQRVAVLLIGLQQVLNVAEAAFAGGDFVGIGSCHGVYSWLAWFRKSQRWQMPSS